MKRIISAIVAAACIPCIHASACDTYQIQTEWCELSDIVAMARVIAEDPCAPAIREGIRMDADTNGIVNGNDIAIQLRHMALRPLYDAIRNDIEQQWLETYELFCMEHENESCSMALTVSSGLCYGTELAPEPYANAFDYIGDFAAGDIVLQMECESECMEVYICNASEYGHEFQ